MYCNENPFGLSPSFHFSLLSILPYITVFVYHIPFLSLSVSLSLYLLVARQRVNGEFVGGSSAWGESGDQPQTEHHDHTN